MAKTMVILEEQHTVDNFYFSSVFFFVESPLPVPIAASSFSSFRFALVLGFV